MLSELVAFLGELFPSISPYTKQGAMDAMKQFENYNIKSRFLTTSLDDDLQQGDIFTLVPFVFIDENGDVNTLITKGMLLTNSCDATRNDELQFAAMYRLEDYQRSGGDTRSIVNNKNYQFLYYPDNEIDGWYVDFGTITSISRVVFLRLMEEHKSERLASLNDIGWFVLITKLTVFFMRPDDPEVLESRTSSTPKCESA